MNRNSENAVVEHCACICCRVTYESIAVVGCVGILFLHAFHKRQSVVETVDSFQSADKPASLNDDFVRRFTRCRKIKIHYFTLTLK